MAKYSLEEQKKMHLDHLRSEGFNITDLIIGAEKYTSCLTKDSVSVKRIACYKAFQNEMPDGSLSLFTNYKTPKEEWKKFKTFGMPDKSEGEILGFSSENKSRQDYEDGEAFFRKEDFDKLF